jgi:hypothetical protein
MGLLPWIGNTCHHIPEALAFHKAAQPMICVPPKRSSEGIRSEPKKVKNSALFLVCPLNRSGTSAVCVALGRTRTCAGKA